MPSCTSRTPLSRGTFARVRTWDELAASHAVYRNEYGEYIQFCTGDIVYRSNPALAGLTGVILGTAIGGRSREMRLSNGEAATITVEVLVPLTFNYDAQDAPISTA